MLQYANLFRKCFIGASPDMEKGIELDVITWYAQQGCWTQERSGEGYLLAVNAFQAFNHRWVLCILHT